MGLSLVYVTSRTSVGVPNIFLLVSTKRPCVFYLVVVDQLALARKPGLGVVLDTCYGRHSPFFLWGEPLEDLHAPPKAFL